MKTYPNIQKLIKGKEANRRRLAALPFEDKIELVFRLQKRRRFMKSGQLVEQRRAQARTRK